MIHTIIKTKGECMNTKYIFSITTTHIIMASFMIFIIIGSILLALPISSANGNSVPYVDALFTATTARNPRGMGFCF